MFLFYNLGRYTEHELETLLNDGAIVECRHSTLSAVKMYLDAGDWEKTTVIRKARDAKMSQVKKLDDGEEDDAEAEAFDSTFNKINPYTAIADVDSQLKAILGDNFGAEEAQGKGQGKNKSKNKNAANEVVKEDKVTSAALGYVKAQAMAHLVQGKLALVEEVQAQLTSSRYSSPGLLKDTTKIIKDLRKESGICKSIFITKTMELVLLSKWFSVFAFFVQNIAYIVLVKKSG